ncbi:hypothetical protein BDA96_01G084400 [Sorghum bicolor]|uniref:Uncharacterized protein n=2 Tax=Sorghum bicolor TaxID=4558 RepID=A0A921RWH3_SORBI|nr:hypothetical protein BDA96_01G084400 [Sorghum bicolor]OQU90939.1 hypothetical protein SORBI_3001G080950 [Sorghum bicolor]
MAARTWRGLDVAPTRPRHLGLRCCPSPPGLLCLPSHRTAAIKLDGHSFWVSSSCSQKWILLLWLLVVAPQNERNNQDTHLHHIKWCLLLIGSNMCLE